MRLTSLLAPILALLAPALPADADGLVPRGATSLGLCYLTGSTGPTVPCVLNGSTWVRVLKPGDDAVLNSLTTTGAVTAGTLVGDGSGASVTATGGNLARALSVIAADVVNACNYLGVNAGAKITAAIAALPATGGEVDARCLQGQQYISTPLVVGSPTKSVQLRLGAATFTTSALVSVDKNSSITGQPSALGIGGVNGGKWPAPIRWPRSEVSASSVA